MFHLAYRRLVSRIVATAALTAAVGACGYKGPLYFPPPPDGRAAPVRTMPSQAQPKPPSPITSPSETEELPTTSSSSDKPATNAIIPQAPGGTSSGSNAGSTSQ